MPGIRPLYPITSISKRMSTEFIDHNLTKTSHFLQYMRLSPLCLPQPVCGIPLVLVIQEHRGGGVGVLDLADVSCRIVSELRLAHEARTSGIRSSARPTSPHRMGLL